MSEVQDKAKQARWASLKMATLNSENRENALTEIADAILREKTNIMKENELDLEKARDMQSRGDITDSLVKRLMMNEEKIRQTADMVRSVVAQEDPIGKTLYAMELDEGLEVYRVSSPIGVVGVIFESRPDALPQIASLCLKSGNAVVLKGGTEASNSNRALFEIIDKTSLEAGIPKGWIQLLEDRQEVAELLELDEYVDLIIPRGSNSLVRHIKENTRIPVLGHSEGVCNIYIDGDADIEKALNVCLDAKIQYTSVCNAVDTILVYSGVAEEFLPNMKQRYENAGVEIRGCPITVKIMGEGVKLASEEDWETEFLDYIVAIKVVSEMDEAIQHINTHSSKHTDAIMTRDGIAAVKFMEEVDSSSVIWNASTRFADGYRYGLGAEVGISTGKVHARGPTGLEGLTTYKYYLTGTGQTVSSYYGSQAKEFTHRHISKTWKDIKENLQQ
jgi:glutamate-5-semialdehyde dehydrogenase